MANCTDCGAKLREGALFCVACGAKIAAQQPIPQPPPPAYTAQPPQPMAPPQYPQQSQQYPQPQYQQMPQPQYAMPAAYPQKKKSKAPIVITLIIILLMAASAAIAIPLFIINADPIAGTWVLRVDETQTLNSLSDSDMNYLPEEYSFTFNGDGTFSMESRYHGEYVKQNGTWEKTDNEFTFTATDEEWAGEVQRFSYTLSDGKLVMDMNGYKMVFRK